MINLPNLTDNDLFPGVPAADPTGFHRRESVRAVLRDDRGRIALLKLGLHSTHKLPGGGIEAGEDRETALKREVLEETGCNVTLTAELGTLTEHRAEDRLEQISHCFLASLEGVPGQPSFSEKEMVMECEVVWADGIDHAIALIKNDQPQNYPGKFVRRRDLIFLEAAKPLLPE